MFDTQVPHLENVLESHYAGDVKSFIQQYLEPVLALLTDIKTSAVVGVKIEWDVLLTELYFCNVAVQCFNIV